MGGSPLRLNSEQASRYLRERRRRSAERWSAAGQSREQEHVCGQRHTHSTQLCLSDTHTHTPHILSLQTCVRAVRTSRRLPASCSSSPWHFGCCRVVVAHRPILHEGSRRRPPSNLTRSSWLRAIRKNAPMFASGYVELSSNGGQVTSTKNEHVALRNLRQQPQPARLFVCVLARVLPGLEVALAVAQVFYWGWQLKARVIF